MLVISETRRKRLLMLEEQHGSLASLNEALGLPRTDSRLSQIKNQSKHSRTGQPRTMGDDTARFIENQLALPIGWMDTPPSYETTHARLAAAMRLMESLPDWKLDQAYKIIDAIAEPRNGTTND